MSLKVTVNVFSGRENPSFTIADGAAKKFLDNLSISSFKNQTTKTDPFPSVLGYRGVTVEQSGSGNVKDLPQNLHLAHDNVYTETTLATGTNTGLEALVFDNIEKVKGFDDVKNLKKLIQTSMADYLDKRAIYKANHFKFFDKTLADFITPIRFKTCICSPVPDLANWNGSFQGSNNCYNYGTNYRTDTFAQPGKASSNQYTSLASCSPAGQVSAKQGAISDGLIELPTNNNTCPKTGHLAALVNWPNADFHWYRKGSNGKWSHKPGGTPATILDNSGNPITDPRTADRGNYTNFCSFMQVIHGHFKVK